MTEPTDETTVPEAVAPADEPTDLPDGDDTGGPKEARFRRERNEARAEVATLAERIAGYQRAEVERIAAETMAHASDVFSLSGNDVTDYLTDDGHIDADKVKADVAAILAERPGLARRASATDPSQGSGGDRPRKHTSTWADVIQN